MRRKAIRSVDIIMKILLILSLFQVSFGVFYFDESKVNFSDLALLRKAVENHELIRCFIDTQLHKTQKKCFESLSYQQNELNCLYNLQDLISLVYQEKDCRFAKIKERGERCKEVLSKAFMRKIP